MKKVYAAMERELLVLESSASGRWEAQRHLIGMQPVSLAVDPFDRDRLYCGTFGRGLWRSEDGGASWRPVGDPGMSMEPAGEGGIEYPNVMAVAVSPNEGLDGRGVVYAGTEPTALYKSWDGGQSWEELKALKELPSATEWSFPARPHTSHVRWISPDPHVTGRLFVAIEAGALVRSFDGGKSWADRVEGGPFDTHTLATHPLARDRLYSAAGDGFMQAGTGFAESFDAGKSWRRPGSGLEHHYLWGLAVDPADPDNILVSASSSPMKAHHDRKNPEGYVYRRTGRSDWKLVKDGLPEPDEGLVPILAADAAQQGTFYALTGKGIYRSLDAGANWEGINVPWREEYGYQHHQALVVTG